MGGFLGAGWSEWRSWISGLLPQRGGRRPRRLQHREDLARLEARARIWEAAAATAGWSMPSLVSWAGEKYSGALTYPSVRTMNHPHLRRRARIAYWDSVQARALIGRLVDNVVNIGLRLEAAPVWALLDAPANQSEEQRRDWVRQVEARFGLWAQSKEPDAAGRMSLYEMQAFLFLNVLRDGEIFPLYRRSPDEGRMNPLQVQFVDPDQVCDPGDRTMLEAVRLRGNRVRDGIEIDSNGRELAYYVHDGETGKTVRVPVRGPKSGRLFASHIGVFDSVGQVRATPPLAAVIHELQKLTDYTVAEIEAAVINATIAAWIKPAETASASRALSGVMVRGSSAAQTDAGDSREAPPSQGYIERPGLLVQTLKAGEELQSYDTKRPNQSFEMFVKAIKSGISSSLGIPVEVLDMSFNANYSASRASLILFWNVVEKWRSMLASDFLDPVYAGWLRGEIEARRVEAAGWNVPVMRAAWLNCSWIGINKPSIDPAREAQAATRRLAAGLTTRERESRQYNGSEYGENIERLRVENRELSEANEPLAEQQMEEGP